MEGQRVGQPAEWSWYGMTDEEAQPYEIFVESFGACPVIRLTGEFDLRAAPDLREALVGVLEAPDAEGKPVLVDMEELSFLDSTIISVLLSAEQLAQRKSRRVSLVSVPDHVSRIFGVTGIEGVLRSYPTKDDAVAAGSGK